MDAYDGEHGYSAYSRGLCRCETCRGAKARRVRDLRTLRRAERLRVEALGLRNIVEGVTHGIGAYTNAMCRCDTCVDAKKQYDRRAKVRRYRNTQIGA